MRTSHHTLICILCFALGSCLDVSSQGLLSNPNSNGGGNGGGTTTVSWALDIQPIFSQDCIHCHGGAGGLNLESYDGVIAGGQSGAVVLPGNPDQSLLPRRLDGTLPPVMPTDGPPLTPPEVDRIKQWILEGAQDN